MSHKTYKISLDQLVTGIAEQQSIPDAPVHKITSDSRQVTKGAAFIAFPGDRADGRDFIQHAINQGAVAIIYEADWKFETQPSIPCIAIENCQQRLGDMAARFYQHPSKELTVIGVTGTNGKTSVTQFIAQALSQQQSVAVMGTLGAGVWPKLEKTGFTTPDVIAVHAFLAQCRDDGVKVVAMEVSSHALVQARVAAVSFDIAVFTNLSHEHLDYHQDMQHYAKAKESLLKTPGLKTAVINADDAIGQQWIRHYAKHLNIYAYTVKDQHQSDCEMVAAKQIEMHAKGLSCQVETPWGAAALQTPLFGLFNLENVLAVLAVLNILEMPFDSSIDALNQLSTVAGRMQLFTAANKPTVIVDFSHTPDALQQALQACRQHCDGVLWCVFGCGGDRDKSKRPQMAAIAEQLSDHQVVTNDNPRSEDPQQIADDICQGFTHRDYVNVILNRASAIQYAIDKAQNDDLVLVAGKGHETEQIIGDRMLPFSDVEQVQKQLYGSAS